MKKEGENLPLPPTGNAVSDLIWFLSDLIPPRSKSAVFFKTTEKVAI